jgi:hypothetical protein
MPRAGKPQKPRHDPLHVEVEQDQSLKQYGRMGGKRKQKKESQDDDEDVSWNCFSLSVSTADTVIRKQKMHGRVNGF